GREDGAQITITYRRVLEHTADDPEFLGRLPVQRCECAGVLLLERLDDAAGQPAQRRQIGPETAQDATEIAVQEHPVVEALHGGSDGPHGLEELPRIVVLEAGT